MRPSAPPVDPITIIPFVTGAKHVFSTMLGIAVNVGTPHVKRANAPTYDVTGIIGFSGEVAGWIVVSFQKEAALQFAEAFTGEQASVDSPDFADAIGEFANMIAGAGKKELGRVTNISIPSVIVGGGHSVARLRDVPCLVVPCSTSAGLFAIESSLKFVDRAAA